MAPIRSLRDTFSPLDKKSAASSVLGRSTCFLWMYFVRSKWDTTQIRRNSAQLMQFYLRKIAWVYYVKLNIFGTKLFNCGIQGGSRLHHLVCKTPLIWSVARSCMNMLWIIFIAYPRVISMLKWANFGKIFRHTSTFRQSHPMSSQVRNG